MAFLLILDARLVPKAAILSPVPTVRIYETERQVPSYKRSTRLVMGKTTRCVVFRVLRCFLPCTTGIPHRPMDRESSNLWIMRADFWTKYVRSYENDGDSASRSTDFWLAVQDHALMDLKLCVRGSAKIGLLNRLREKSGSTPQGLKPEVKQSPYRSVKNAAPPKNRVFPQTAVSANRVFPSTAAFCKQRLFANRGCSQSANVLSRNFAA